jgi:nitroreductase
MELDEVIRRRKMIRRYEKRQVPEQLIGNAARAPSAGHTQV